MAEETGWIEYSKLVLSAATPLTIVALGWWIKKREQINGELIKKRIAIYDQIAPAANDILCFYTAVGHWRDLDPDVMLKRKREIDRIMHYYRHFWSEDCWNAFNQFISTCFETYQGAGAPAALRLNLPYLTSMLGPAWRDEWLSYVIATSEPPTPAQVRSAYDNWMRCLSADIGAGARPTLAASRSSQRRWLSSAASRRLGSPPTAP